MRIHHLNCGTLRPISSATMVCHVLLIESDRGLTLVDTGFGRADIADPARRLGSITRVIRPAFDHAETALAQIEALGFQRDDVTDIVATHLDCDHSGGIEDFPKARLHASARELATATAKRGPSESIRYRPWRRDEPGNPIQSYAAFPDSWFGFRSAAIDGFEDQLTYIALPGHTEGHMGVAVRDGDGWLLHAGDAFYHRNAAAGRRVPGMMAVSQFATAMQPRQARTTRRRIADLATHAGEQVRIICAHDAQQLADCRPGA